MKLCNLKMTVAVGTAEVHHFWCPLIPKHLGALLGSEHRIMNQAFFLTQRVINLSLIKQDQDHPLFDSTSSITITFPALCWAPTAPLSAPAVGFTRQLHLFMGAFPSAVLILTLSNAPYFSALRQEELIPLLPFNTLQHFPPSLHCCISLWRRFLTHRAKLSVLYSRQIPVSPISL